MFITPKKVIRKTSKNNKDYLSILDQDGKRWFSCWLPQYYSYFMEGAIVDVTTESNGEFVNIVGVNTNPAPQVASAQVENAKLQPKTEAPNWPEIRAEQNDNISLLNAKNNATTLLAAAIEAGNINFEGAVKLFDELVKTINQVK